MFKSFIVSIVLGLLLLGCAELPIKDEPAEGESTELSAEELIYQRQKETQRQMMHENRPFRMGPGRR